MFTDQLFAAISQKTKESMSTSTLVQQAVQFLNEARKKVISPSDISVQELLQAILDYAPCDTGRRFAACAIIGAAEAVGSEAEHEDMGRAERLALLARDWLKFVLWPVKSAHRLCLSRHSSMSSAGLTEIQHVSATGRKRQDEFTRKVKKREAGRCAVTSRRNIPAAAHFIRPPIYAENEPEIFHRTITWDILRLYAGLPDECTENPEKFLRSPANGMYLNPEMRKTFDRFYWYLLPLDEPNTYRYVPLHEDMDDAVPAHRTLVTFSDHSGLGIALPHPRLVGLHAALTRVLHHTGTGEFFDRMFDRYLGEDHDLAAPVGKFCGDDLELRMALLAVLDEEVSSV
ncbi:hypothetical protein CERSUDRAFT_118445 [Gelatoporia subvermispora B]|uniref:HNH nuclease domain-containing protein n=1 Tax=Ceriporiopsis subvermispora (strain B) TaxID=914234 RepID=M2Q761_CERS8|nr:hypothetical protein CERSUDRAFT_118445 [Gelatoporia subvermispora B]